MANPSDEATPKPSSSDESVAPSDSSKSGDVEESTADPAPDPSIPRGHDPVSHDHLGSDDHHDSEHVSHSPSSGKVMAEPGPSPGKHTLANPGTSSDPYQENPYESDYNHDEYHHDPAHQGDSDSHGEEEANPPDHGAYLEAPHKASEPRGAHDSEDTWDDEDEAGGPVKSFLEHLEDFRWVIIRCLSSLAIGMVLCLVAGPQIVKLLQVPLDEAQMSQKHEGPLALLQFGTNEHVLHLDSQQLGGLPLGTNQAIKLTLSPLWVGTNLVMGLTQTPIEREDLPPANRINLKNLGPLSAFVVALKIALFGGIGLASPFILFFIGHFVVPALHKKEKRYLYRALAVGSLLFASGVLFCYFFMLKVALAASVAFSQWMSFEADIWRAEEYISFVVKFMLGMGLSFELPVVLLTLVKLDLIDYPRMVKFRPYWVIVNMAIASMLTPPDPFSMLLMALPLQVLFEISLLIARHWWRQDQKRRAQEEAA